MAAPASRPPRREPRAGAWVERGVVGQAGAGARRTPPAPPLTGRRLALPAEPAVEVFRVPPGSSGRGPPLLPCLSRTLQSPRARVRRTTPPRSPGQGGPARRGASRLSAGLRQPNSPSNRSRSSGSLRSRTRIRCPDVSSSYQRGDASPRGSPAGGSILVTDAPSSVSVRKQWVLADWLPRTRRGHPRERCS